MFLLFVNQFFPLLFVFLSGEKPFLCSSGSELPKLIAAKANENWLFIVPIPLLFNKDCSLWSNNIKLR